MNFLYWTLAWVGLSLEVLVALRLFRDSYYKQFSYWFAYSIVLVITGGVDLSFRLSSALASSAELSNNTIGLRAIEYYWVNDSLRQFALFLVIVSLLYDVLKGQPAQRWAILAVILVAGGSVMFFWDEPLSALCTMVIRNVSFAVVFLNLVLWSALIRSGKFNRLQMMITSGIGLQMTGEAIGQALRSAPIRHNFPAVVAIGNVILVLSHLLCLTIWLVALKADKKALQARLAAENARSNSDAERFGGTLREMPDERPASHAPQL